MKIAIDLRSLSSGTISGVENYCLNLLEHLLPLDKQNFYTLFFNSYKNPLNSEFHVVNSKVKFTAIPNKLLNLSFKFKLYNLEKLLGFANCLFMPNVNQLHIGSKIKLVVTVHDLSPVITPSFYDLKRKIWHKFLNLKSVLERANAIIAVSEHTRLDLIRIFHVPESKIKVIYPGVDPKIYNTNIDLLKLRFVRNKYLLPARYLLFLNTIEPRKNLSSLIKAFELLNDQDIHLVIAGRKGWKYKRIIRQMRDSVCAKRICYLGYIEEKHKPTLIQMAKALVYPSFYEGFGFQPIEAEACGVPVIVSNVTALPEVLKDSVVLINPHDFLEIKRALDLILSSTNFTDMLIKKGLANVSRFTWHDTAKKTLEVIQA